MSFKGLAKVFHDLGFSPNSISIIGLFLSVFSAILYGFSHMDNSFITIAAVLFLLSGLSDIIDGLMAEMFDETSSFGEVLDSVSDRYGDAMVLSGIIIGGLCDVSWGLVALIGSILVSYVRARVEVEGIKMESVGLMERAERIILIFSTSILNVFYSGVLAYSIILLAVLTNFTVLQRMIYFFRATST